MGRKRVTTEERKRADRLAVALREKRELEGLSIQDAATEAGLRYGTAVALLRGASAGPNFFHVLDLAEALDIGLDQLAEKVK